MPETGRRPPPRAAPNPPAPRHSRSVPTACRRQRRYGLRRKGHQVVERRCSTALALGHPVHQQRVQAGLAHPLEGHVPRVCQDGRGRGGLGRQPRQPERGRGHHPHDAGHQPGLPEDGGSHQHAGQLDHLRAGKNGTDSLHGKAQVRKVDVVERIEASGGQVPHRECRQVPKQKPAARIDLGALRRRPATLRYQAGSNASTTRNAASNSAGCLPCSHAGRQPPI